jgi:4-hydroxybenzoyl-CoA thioesterase/acyl-CoA thioester hydrolase
MGATNRMGSFRWERRVEFCETDAAGIAHFSSILQYMEQAEHALLRSVGASVFSPDETAVTWPRVHVEADFLGPASFEDTVVIDVWIARIGSSSVRYRFELHGPRGPVAKGESVSVCCRRVRDPGGIVTLEKVPVPASLHSALTPYLD